MDIDMSKVVQITKKVHWFSNTFRKKLNVEDFSNYLEIRISRIEMGMVLGNLDRPYINLNISIDCIGEDPITRERLDNIHYGIATYKIKYINNQLVGELTKFNFNETFFGMKYNTAFLRKNAQPDLPWSEDVVDLLYKVDKEEIDGKLLAWLTYDSSSLNI